MANLDKKQLKAIQDGQTWEEVSKEQKANFDKVADAVNGKAESSVLSGYVTTTNAESTYAKKTELTSLATKAELANKVDKDGSKVLSEKNFTAAYETKLKGIAEKANNYVHPTGNGNNHIPAGGEANQVLVWSSAGAAAWGAVPAAASTMSYTPVKAPAKAMGSMVTAEEYNSLIDKLIAAGVFTA